MGDNEDEETDYREKRESGKDDLFDIDDVKVIHQ